MLGGVYLSESRRKEFGGENCTVWVEVVKSGNGKISTSFGSESDIKTEGEKLDQESVFQDIDDLVAEVKAKIDEANAWAKSNAEDLI